MEPVVNGAEPLSVRAVRRWLALYTSGLPMEARERRCLELESDRWEHLHDTSETDATRAVLRRFLRGIPADVRWRYRTLLEARGARQRSREMTTSLRQAALVNGSQLIFAGAVLTLLGGLEFIPVGIIVLASGFWTGNLQLSEPTDGPDLRPVRDHQITMTRYWYLWLGAAAVLFAVGWLPLIFDDGPNAPSGLGPV